MLFLYSISELMKKYLLYLVGAAVGGLGGFLYWKYEGCLTGTCKITSSPVNSTLYFAMMGALLFSMFKKQEKHGS
jgi:hypothetical protein